MECREFAVSLLLAMALLLPGGQASAEVNERTASPANRIIDVTDDMWQPQGFINGVRVPVSYLMTPDRMLIDGLENEDEWQRAEDVTVPLSHGHVTQVSLKALYTDTDVYIRVRWPDAVENREHRPWVWDTEKGVFVESDQVEDSVLLSFEAGCEWTPSLLGGYIYDFDAWHWMAGRSDPLGQAVDLYGNVQDRDLVALGFAPYRSRITEDDWVLKFTEKNDVDLYADWFELDRVYLLQEANEQLYIKVIPDGAPQSPPFVERLAAPGEPLPDGVQSSPQFIPVPLTGGAAEVRAKGTWSEGYWTVEFVRARVTPAGHQFDTKFNRLIQFSVHVFDRTDRIDEVSESPRLFLTFLPKEVPLVAQD